ncbi:hypothetical protein [Oricola thermophila]|uniref:Uncharacterized protein n=1 Tax=Oricola thermophila TaxID=2742145 RepID=A0A6N1VJ35_9HYPH|nr:hypothetical protein [Oricola thermophila]QKV19229.1 hypothetical protein HTY61_12570 [Oricola thermophila]
MNIATFAGAAIAACLLAMPAKAAAFSPISVEPVRGMTSQDGDTAVRKVGYRNGGYAKFHGGISYTGEYGLKYAPSYWRKRHHGHDVNVNIYVERSKRPKSRRGAQPLIIELPR